MDSPFPTSAMGPQGEASTSTPSDPDSFAIRDSSRPYARRSLLLAARELSSRGLDNAATWALELVNCLPDDPSTSSGGQGGGADFFADQARYARDKVASTRGADASLSWPGPFAPTSTPARPSSRPGSLQHSPAQIYPMQSTPFLGAAGGSGGHHVMVSGPSSSPLPASSPRRNGDRMLAAHQSPSPIGDTLAREDASTSTSGRFPPPFRQPPSPLATMSLSADGPAKDGPYSDSKGKNVSRSDEDDSMQEEGKEEEEGKEASRSVHVHFAEGGGEEKSNVSQLDILDAYAEPAIVTESAEDAELELARGYFRLGQLDRCRWVLERRRGRISSSSRESVMRNHSVEEGDKAKFLRGYVGMLIVERDAQSAASMHNSSTAESALRRSLIPLLKDLINPSDPFLLLLKGIILRKLKKRLEAMDCFLRSLLLFPYNWTTWLELNGVIESSAGELEEILPLLPESFMRLFFLEYHHRQAEASSDPEMNARRIERLLCIFPDNAGLWISLAVGRYMQQEFDSSIEAFQKAFDLDPYRLEGLADYSNALFLLDKGDQLAHLAHTTSEWGAETAEVCCVVGNHFYYQSDHARAIEAFKRAIRLDPNCIAAWILLGHTFLEIKNSGAAGEMYRRAIDLNPRDYRPWHGLGKVYELLDSHTFAIHYYLKAAGIAPYTGTIWQSLAMAYAKLDNHREAVNAYKRYLSCESDVGVQLTVMKSIITHLQMQAALDEQLEQRGEDEDEDELGREDHGVEEKKSSQHLESFLSSSSRSFTRSRSRSKRRRAKDEAEANINAWNSRAVRLLYLDHHRRVVVKDGSGGGGSGGVGEAKDQDLKTKPDHHLDSNLVESSDLQDSKATPIDISTWGASILQAARSEVGLDPSRSHFFPPLSQEGEGGGETIQRGNILISLRYLDWLLLSLSSSSSSDTNLPTSQDPKGDGKLSSTSPIDERGRGGGRGGRGGRGEASDPEPDFRTQVVQLREYLLSLLSS